MTWHGFRALASTQLHELGWNDRWIETQLSHADRNKIRGSYNHAKYLPQRRTMMQAWGDHLDEITKQRRHALEIRDADRMWVFRIYLEFYFAGLQEIGEALAS